MEVMEKIILIGITGAAAAVLLKKDSPVFALVVSLTTGIVIFFFIADMLSYAVMSVKMLFLNCMVDEEILGIVLKICAVGIVSEYFCGIIADAGEEGISKKIELGAKTVIFTMTLPLIIKIIDSIWGVM